MLFAATPELLADVNLTSDHLAPRDMVTAGSVGYFAGRNSPADGHELFRTDGTRAGTVMVRDIVPGIAGSDPQSLTVVGNRVFFSAADSNGDRELYVSDGTAGGTVRVKDVKTTGSSRPARLTAAGSDLYFVTEGTGSNEQLYRSDGTAAGTVPVNRPSGSAMTSVWGITPFNGGVLVLAGSARRACTTSTMGSSPVPSAGTKCRRSPSKGTAPTSSVAPVAATRSPPASSREVCIAPTARRPVRRS